EQMRDAVDAAVPGAASTTAWGTPALDLPGAVARQLEAAGVGRVASLGLCTLTDERWFSHRGAGQGRSAGRFAGVVRPGVSQRPDAGAGLA
ncbi:MAG: hypothetical protein HGA44_06275, partial [Cellulomonadaceae bacterium]|nr:hypothetical protein [Cellulomonadaceae bacterium]